MTNASCIKLVLEHPVPRQWVYCQPTSYKHSITERSEFSFLILWSTCELSSFTITIFYRGSRCRWLPDCYFNSHDASSKEDEKGEESSSTATAVIEQQQTDNEFNGWRCRKRSNTPSNTGAECHVARTYINGVSFGCDDASSACYNVSSMTGCTADVNTLKNGIWRSRCSSVHLSAWRSQWPRIDRIHQRRDYSFPFWSDTY